MMSQQRLRWGNTAAVSPICGVFIWGTAAARLCRYEHVALEAIVVQSKMSDFRK